MQLPIFKFHNIFKSVIWGGTRIAEFKGLPSQGDNIGESWELSPIPGNESVVDGGEFDGTPLSRLVEMYPKELLGKDVYNKYGAKFPLLIKFIDSNEDLSVQVHPDDALAGARHNQWGKTEMWYSIAPAKDAYFYAGFKERLTKEQFCEKVNDNTIIGALNKFRSHKGDVVEIPAGRIHSLGSGNFVCEIQQASDITYRIYDYDRRDADGNRRKLHIEESIDALNFDDIDTNVKNIEPLANKDVVLNICPHFVSTLLTVNATGNLDLPKDKSFTIFVCIKGSATLEDPDGNKTAITQGTTVLLPASMPTVWIKPLKGEVQIITTSIIN